MDAEKYQMEMTARTANFVARTTPVTSRDVRPPAPPLKLNSTRILLMQRQLAR